MFNNKRVSVSNTPMSSSTIICPFCELTLIGDEESDSF